ncbi:hypothetical protein B0H19DRAFT_1085626 [Mycena capillaripes]|nr:hypothetical protein B0H19DRAFT_1085626 [Mycena capillaripes]
MTLKPFDGQGPAYDKLRQNHNASEMISPQLDREPRSASIKENKAREKHGTRVNESAKNNTPASPGVLPSKNSARAAVEGRSEPAADASIDRATDPQVIAAPPIDAMGSLPRCDRIAIPSSDQRAPGSWRTRPNQLAQRVLRDSTMAIPSARRADARNSRSRRTHNPLAFPSHLHPIERCIPLNHAGLHLIDSSPLPNLPLPQLQATRYARVADNPPTRLMRLRTLRSMSTQVFGSEEEENVYTGAEAGQGKRRAYPCPEVRARGEGRNWEIRGGWLVIETGARLQTSGTRSALALANSARGSRIEQNDATPVYGLETTKDEYRAPVGALQCFKRVAMPVQERRYRPARRAEAACRQKSASA